MVMAARARNDPASDAALARLCDSYWYPLYVFVRRLGHDPDEALDLTQGYFLRLLERDYLKDVRPEAGRFRCFLLASLKHYIANERRAAGTWKRGGRRHSMSLDATSAESRFRLEPLDDTTPEKAYERRWAAMVIGRARDRLEREFADAGKIEQYRALAGFLSGDDPGRPYRDVAAALRTSEASVKMGVLRLRRRLGRLLREEIADTVSDPREVEDEVRHLLAVVRS
jgi:RNA polymerase sigma-70 factor (ECF subfamily)